MTQYGSMAYITDTTMNEQRRLLSFLIYLQDSSCYDEQTTQITEFKDSHTMVSK